MFVRGSEGVLPKHYSHNGTSPLETQVQSLANKYCQVLKQRPRLNPHDDLPAKKAKGSLFSQPKFQVPLLALPAVTLGSQKGISLFCPSQSSTESPSSCNKKIKYRTFHKNETRQTPISCRRHSNGKEKPVLPRRCWCYLSVSLAILIFATVLRIDSWKSRTPLRLKQVTTAAYVEEEKVCVIVNELKRMEVKFDKQSWISNRIVPCSSPNIRTRL